MRLGIKCRSYQNSKRVANSNAWDGLYKQCFEIELMTVLAHPEVSLEDVSDAGMTQTRKLLVFIAEELAEFVASAF